MTYPNNVRILPWGDGPGWIVTRGKFDCGYFRDLPFAEVIALAVSRFTDREWQALCDDVTGRAAA